MTVGLESIVASLGPVALALSGGIDSMALAVFAHRLLGAARIQMVHAMSPAVPLQASQRVKDWASMEGWDLHLIDAGEFADPNYVTNPVNRCFFCKGNLYGTIAGLTKRQIISGANTDDLGEYRPGLVAARNQNVRHPYVEAAMSKRDVRSLARRLGMGALAELPSSPCLSSRVETGIIIDPDVLAAVNAAEMLVTTTLSTTTVRCRVRRTGLVIELDHESLSRLTAAANEALQKSIPELFPAGFSPVHVEFAPYRTGSAFIGAKL